MIFFGLSSRLMEQIREIITSISHFKLTPKPRKLPICVVSVPWRKYPTAKSAKADVEQMAGLICRVLMVGERLLCDTRRLTHFPSCHFTEQANFHSLGGCVICWHGGLRTNVSHPNIPEVTDLPHIYWCDIVCRKLIGFPSKTSMFRTSVLNLLTKYLYIIHNSASLRRPYRRWIHHANQILRRNKFNRNSLLIILASRILGSAGKTGVLSPSYNRKLLRPR